MEFSFSLARHRLQAAQESARLRRAPQPDEPPPPRPQGRLLWVHASRGAPLGGAIVLIDDLRARHPDLAVLVTGASLPGALTSAAPADTGPHAGRFLDHWSPDMILWVGAEPFPTVWTEALARQIPVIAIESDPASFSLPLVRPMNGFEAVLTLRPDNRLSDVVLRTTGPLATAPRPPAAHAGDLAALTKLLTNRPVWLASAATLDDIPIILEAHRLAAQLAHRLLLLLEPDESVDGRELRDRLVQAGWSVVLRSDGEEPDVGSQIYIVDESGETGLWTRLASITLTGGSMAGPVMTRDPLVAASLGSVVLHGPHVAPHGASLSKLQKAQAAWRVADADELGQAVERFLAPEKAAEMANAAWQVTTEGAEASAIAIEILENCLAARTRTG